MHDRETRVSGDLPKYFCTGPLTARLPDRVIPGPGRMTKRDDEDLAHTATAASGDARETTPLDAPTLGRYRLERKLGEGGMGVVHAAFDPDLERRVALKVLRVDDRSGSSEARQRLLLEARAMARLTHPNVVVVHEVGNAHGRDYVAMELIDGDSVSDWLRAAKRDPEAILSAFLAAGRGLAAAHAANLVHRDFKPHNILRGHDGRVVVTDFGLARGLDTLPAIKPDAFETTIDAANAANAANTPSSLSGLTLTGSVLGTPAYMAPEQWNAQTIGPAADQFAFCVALWEALVGERPYRGDTVEQLKAAVERGPESLDASRLPRQLRKAVLRGLDPDPDKRWPSMNALLARLARKQRSRLAIVLVAGGAALAAVGIAVSVTRSNGNVAPPLCPPAARDVATVWSPSVRQRLAGRGDLVTVIDANTKAWSTARATACITHETDKLACLDGSLARTDAIVRATANVSGKLSDQLAGLLVAPSVCSVTSPPRLTVTPNAETVAALTFYAGSHPGKTVADEASAAAFAAKPGLDPCARAFALLAVDQITTDVPRGKAATLEAITAADACGDDRLRADAILAEYLYEAESPTVGPRGIAALQKASVAVKRVAQPDLAARIDTARATYAAQQGHWDEAFAAAQTALDEVASSGPLARLRAVRLIDGLRFQRNTAGDMAAVRALVAKWRPVAVALHDDRIIDGLDQSDAYARLFLGEDLASAHADIDRLWRKHHPQNTSAPLLRGTVVDERGVPVVGATVAVGTKIFADAIGPLPFGVDTGDFQTTVTDEHGAYALAAVSPKAMIVAQSDPRHRSDGIRAEPNLRIVVHATRRIAGNVALGATPSTRAFVMASLANAHEPGRFVMSPIGADGTYALEGVTTAEIKIGVATWGAAESTSIGFQVVPAGNANLHLALAAAQSERTLDVIVRSRTASPFESAQVFVLSGKHAFATIGELTANHHLLGLQVRWAQPIVGEAVPANARGLTHSGDLVAHFTDVSGGEVSACVMGLNIDVADPVASRAVTAHNEELVVSCATPEAKAAAIVVEAPEQKRFD